MRIDDRKLRFAFNARVKTLGTTRENIDLMATTLAAVIAYRRSRLPTSSHLASWLLIASLGTFVFLAAGATAQSQTGRQQLATRPRVRGQQFSGVVTRVSDGDTIQVS